MDSDSDRTVDSDELQVMLTQNRKRKSPSKISTKSTKVHTISDSESDTDDSLKKSKNEIKSTKIDNRPKCRYGKKCYRKNPDHLKNFSHEVESTNEVNKLDENKSNPQTVQRTSSDASLDYDFYVTKVDGIPNKYNNELTLDIKDILNLKDGGPLISSVQFNYMFDIDWLMRQYPIEYRKCPLTIVHGEQRESKTSLEKSGFYYPNVKFCQAKLDIPYGTHHTKMMFLLYQNGFRIVIHTSNIVKTDWAQKTQGIWMSPVLPEATSDKSDSETNFKADFLEYISSYERPELKDWCDIIKKHDFSKVKVFLIGSVPGRHVGSKKTAFGHLKLRKVFNLHGISQDVVQSDWPVVGQFSSIGSLGASSDLWLTGEFLTSLSTTQGSTVMNQLAPLKLVYPSVENVRKSLEGYPAGASLPYSIKVAQKQPYLKKFLHNWKSDILGRTEASPHIKTYLRISKDNSKVGWFIVTSANLSKAAWGVLEKKGSQLMVRSYELGVLFLPKYFGKDIFSSPASSSYSNIFPIPYNIPLEPYSDKDEPWIWDIPHIKGPDRFGNMWCPT